jgi:hypothetical protein
MIQLTEEQTRALDAPHQPAVDIDPRNGQEYLLVKREVYEKVQKTLKPWGRAWEFMFTAVYANTRRHSRNGCAPGA